VLQTIRRRALLGDADRVAVAISGGPDSVALAWVLRELEAKARWRVAGLIHVHHGLRGPEADADEAFCRALAGRMDLSIDVVHRDVTRRSREARLSVEAAARQVRYEAFEAARARLGASLVATGHTLDDQAETVLLRVLRGAGSRGMAAIRARLGPVIRPLIDARRSAVLEYLDGRREAFREDSTNRDLTIPRNRVRARLMPIVESDWPTTRGGWPRSHARPRRTGDWRMAVSRSTCTPSIRCPRRWPAGSCGRPSKWRAAVRPSATWTPSPDWLEPINHTAGSTCPV
jgi:tRNA(Ile)-lysidine synthase